MSFRRSINPVVALLICTGCGGGATGVPREPVSGKVALDGQPLSAGSITFIPQGSGPSAGGQIAGGEYAIGRADGPSPGVYRVEIIAVSPTGRKVADPDNPGQTIDETKNSAPPRYNANSELKAEVKAGGPNTFNFELTAKPTPRNSRR